MRDAIKLKTTDALILLKHYDQLPEFLEDLNLYLLKNSTFFGFADYEFRLKKIMDAAVKNKSVLYPSAGKFYEDHKEIIDSINEIDNFFAFIIRNVELYSKEKLTWMPNAEKLMFYVAEHKDQRENMIGVINKLQELEFDNFTLDITRNFANELNDFTQLTEERSFSTTPIYAKMIAKATHHGICYQTQDSPYRIDLNYFFNNKKREPNSQEITLNSLTFDSKLLPDSLDKTYIQGVITGTVTDKVKMAQSQINALVNAKVAVLDMNDAMRRLSTTIAQLNSEKASLLQDKVAEMNRQVNAFGNDYSSYEQRVIKESQVAPEQLQEGVTNVLSKRRLSMIDID